MRRHTIKRIKERERSRITHAALHIVRRKDVFSLLQKEEIRHKPKENSDQHTEHGTPDTGENA